MGLIAGMRPGEMLLKYKCPNQIRREEQELSSWLGEQLAKSDRVNELAKAVMDDDHSTLRKWSSPDLADAKEQVAALRAKYGAEIRKSNPNLTETSVTSILRGLIPAHRLATIMSEYTKRCEALEVERRRTRRLVEVWNSLPPYGPWSMVH